MMRSLFILIRPSLCARRSLSFDNGSITASGVSIGTRDVSTFAQSPDTAITIGAIAIIIDTEELFASALRFRLEQTSLRLEFPLIVTGKTFAGGRLRSKGGRLRIERSARRFDIASTDLYPPLLSLLEPARFSSDLLTPPGGELDLLLKTNHRREAAFIPRLFFLLHSHSHYS